MPGSLEIGAEAVAIAGPAAIKLVAEGVKLGQSLIHDGTAAVRTAEAARNVGVGLLPGIHIAEPSLLPKPGLILPYESRIEDLVTRNSFDGKFKTLQEYQERCLTRVPTQVRAYRYRNLEIVTPEELAANIDGGTPRWLGKDRPGLIGPNDLPPLLDEMPHQGYFNRIRISDKPDPYNDWNRQYKNSDTFMSEMSMDNGEFRTFGTMRNPWLRRDVVHEWSHQMRFRFWDDPLSFKFFDATFFEQPEWNPRKYSKTSTDDQWAVLGERMLGTNTNKFLEATEKGPIRTVIYMHALDMSLKEVPEFLQSVNHSNYVARVKHVTDFVREPAAAKAARYRDTAGFDTERAKSLLQFLEQISFQ